jgi:hypothetical protein
MCVSVYQAGDQDPSAGVDHPCAIRAHLSRGHRALANRGDAIAFNPDPAEERRWRPGACDQRIPNEQHGGSAI